ncbi:hypothetical protein GCM10010174_19560 [Kutzneria viridogrisea]|uniref:Uncharacterized protein n=1 Tax=Kutzneria viridogrisea TaxID=47990 RepID=A0ABR6B7Y8_9PSEU|nr:hypothetical protein [Kutzneria viridogrisea]
MTALTVDRLSSTVHGADRAQASRVRRLLGELAERRLDEALRAAELPTGLWCLRRLDVSVRMDFGRGDLALARDWADTLVGALRAALAQRPGEVAHFVDLRHALADLVGSVALGRTDRGWAWRRVDLLGANDPEPADAPREAIVAALRRHPRYALAALLAALREAGPAALQRVLGATGWTAVAQVLLAAGGVPPDGLRAVTGSVRGLSAAGDPPGAGRSPGVGGLAAVSREALPGGGRSLSGDGSPEVDRPLPAEDSPAVDPRDRAAAAILARSAAAGALVRSRLRPDPDTVAAWAVLVLAEAEPGAFARADAPAVLARVAAQLAPGAMKVPLLAFNASNGTFMTPVPTEWAGLPFLLATAQDAGVPARLLADPVLAARPLRWVLHGLATRLVPLSEDDPAALAFCGLDPAQVPPTVDASPASRAEHEALTAHACHWAAVTEERLDPGTQVAHIARRHGCVQGEPGWLELVLPLHEVDLAVRRAGLDVDPGWVPWLGAVVRFRYE